MYDESLFTLIYYVCLAWLTCHSLLFSQHFNTGICKVDGDLGHWGLGYLWHQKWAAICLPSPYTVAPVVLTHQCLSQVQLGHRLYDAGDKVELMDHRESAPISRVYVSFLCILNIKIYLKFIFHYFNSEDISNLCIIFMFSKILKYIWEKQE